MRATVEAEADKPRPMNLVWIARFPIFRVGSIRIARSITPVAFGSAAVWKTADSAPIANAITLADLSLVILTVLHRPQF